MKNKPRYVAKKYMGDCPNSWAVINKQYLPKGHRGVVMDYLPDEALRAAGLNRTMAQYYAKQYNADSKGE